MSKSSARLPHDISLERDLLASCLARPETIPSVGIGEDDFALDAHRLVWSAMGDLFETGDPVDLVRIRTKLIDRDCLGSVGGEGFLATLLQSVPAKSLPLDRLHKMRRLRALRAQAEAVAAAAAGNDVDLASAALEATTALSSDAVARGPKTARQLVEEWQASLNRDPNEGTVSPGLSALKRVIGRLDCGSMTLVGAGVNVGKSTLALEMMFHALLDGENAGYLSMEDPERIVTERLMSIVGGMSAKNVRRYRPPAEGDPHSIVDAQIGKAVAAMHDINDRVLVSNCVGMNERETLDEMTAMARAGCRLIVLDYIGVVGCSQKQQDRRNEIRWIATRFKARAVSNKVALVVVSQLQRPKEGDTARKPNKHSFREAGDLEAMAEYAIVMWRTVEDDFSPVYCELVKSKTGGVGYGWTMQRERYVDQNGSVRGSGRMLEVAHDDDQVYDDDGQRLDIKPVYSDLHSSPRWTTGKTSR